MKNYHRRFSLAAVLGGWLALGAHSVLQAQPTELSLTPASEPLPALRYRLLPLSSELSPGDAAPVYLRLRHEFLEEGWKQIQEKYDAWVPLPFEKFPVVDARNFVNSLGSKTRQLRMGTRRQFCDWSYPLVEQRLEMINIILPDCQSMRRWAHLVAIKAKVEIAEHAYDQAVDTIETGIAFGRHVGQGPFPINNLVGIAICTVMLDRVEELISQPQPAAPNLYWALTVLPRPLLGMREGLETEQRVLENMVPELALADEPHCHAEWSVLVEKLYARLRHIVEKFIDPKVGTMQRYHLDLDLASFKKENLAAARECLKKTLHLDPMRVKVMSDDEVIARAFIGRYRDMRDDYFKITYLPWREARSLSDAAEARLRSHSTGPLAVLAELLLPSPVNCLGAQMRLDRRVVALRVVEAIRLYAAAHEGKLPESMKKVTEVPVPDDPATGKPLEYRRDGASAVLSLPEARMSGKPPAPYRITIRQRSDEKKP